jgi:hypothetical protein
MPAFEKDPPSDNKNSIKGALSNCAAIEKTIVISMKSIQDFHTF